MECQRLALRALQWAIWLVAFTITSPVPGEEKIGEKELAIKLEIQSSWHDALRTSLANRISLKFDNVPLSDVIDHIKQQHKVKLMFDTKNLSDAGVDVTELLVKIDVRDVSVKSVLERMLLEFGITTLPQDEVLLITTREVADSRTDPRIYDVRDLVGHGDGEFDYDPLIDLIGRIIAPQTWGEGGSIPIGSMYGCLIVEQSEEVHEKIAAFLGMLRKVRKQQERGQISDDVRWPLKSPKLEELLLRKTSLSFQKIPLKEAVEELQKRTGIHFDFDKVLYDATIDPLGMPVSIEASEISVQSALNLMCRSIGFSWYAKGDTVIISTPESDCGQFIRIYPVADLVGPHSQSDPEKKLNYPFAKAQALADTITGSIRSQSWSDRGGQGVICTFDDEYPMLVVLQMEEVHQPIRDLLARLREVRHVQVAELAKRVAVPTKPEDPALCVYRLKASDPKVPTMSPKEVADTVKALVAPESWKQEGIYIQAATGRLIVRQTPEVHREILDLLHELEVLAGGGINLPRGRSGGTLGGGF